MNDELVRKIAELLTKGDVEGAVALLLGGALNG